jgi:phospholipid transport system substrate-binding protein
MVSNEALSQDEKSRQFRGLLQQSFALKPIARFVLGRYWKQADDRQRERYVLLFEDYIVQSYSARFGEYAGETFRIIDEKPEGNSGTVVTTMIMRPQGEPVEVQWFVREHKGELKIVDVVIEGISMSLTQRSDFAAAIRKNGGDINAFLDSLEAVSKAN